jgi:periplasmic mercuric ion binding protein
VPTLQIGRVIDNFILKIKYMKKFVLGVLTSCFFLAGSAQIKAADKAVISTPTVQCENCKERIEFFLGKTDGVTFVKVDLKKKTTTVKWLTDRTNKEEIKVTIANLGYVADDIEADEFAYKRLPKTCQKPVEAPKPVKTKG